LRSRVVELDPLLQRLTMEMRAWMWRDDELVAQEEHLLKLTLYFKEELLLLLEGAGFTVIQVNDGNEALAELEARPEIAVLVTDLEMPNKDGFELIADVHGSLATEDLPVIAITGHDELHGRVGQIEGVYGIFKKPWNDRELLKRVESLVHLRTAALRRGRRVTDVGPPHA